MRGPQQQSGTPLSLLNVLAEAPVAGSAARYLTRTPRRALETGSVATFLVITVLTLLAILTLMAKIKLERKVPSRANLSEPKTKEARL